MVFSADCGTILLYDPSRQAIGAVHAGWRGCAAGIAAKTVQAMAEAYGSCPEDLLAALGPCIGQNCFETDGDVPEAMRAALGTDAEPYIQARGPKYHVDLAGLNRQWLLRAGLLPERIEVSGICTACHPELFWSHRKMGDRRGRPGRRHLPEGAPMKRITALAAALALALSLLTGCAQIDEAEEPLFPTEEEPVPEETSTALPSTFSLPSPAGPALNPLTCPDRG